MKVKQLLDEKGRKAIVEIRTSKGVQLLYSGSADDFSKNGYIADECNSISLQDIMQLEVSDNRIPEGCNSIIIFT